MNLDPVKARRDGVGRRLPEIRDDGGNFFDPKRPGHRGVREAVVHEGLRPRRNRGWSDRGRTARLQIDMADTAHMPDLQEDAPALGVNRIRDHPPACDLLRRVDSRGVLIALGLRRDLRRLGDDQPGTGALSVIFGGMRSGDQPGGSAVTGQGGHDDPVGQFQRAKIIRLEDRVLGHLLSLILRSRSLVQKLDGVFQEAVGILELRAVACVGVDDQLGVGDVLHHVPGVDRRDHHIVHAVDDQGRLGDFLADAQKALRGRAGRPNAVFAAIWPIISSAELGGS